MGNILKDIIIEIMQINDNVNNIYIFVLIKFK